jgi:hypothetical protein
MRLGALMGGAVHTIAVHGHRIVLLTTLLTIATFGSLRPAAAATGPQFTGEPPAQIVVVDGFYYTSPEYSATSDAPALELMFQRSTDGGTTWVDRAGCFGAVPVNCGGGWSKATLNENGTLYRAVATDTNGNTAISATTLLTVCDDTSCIVSTFDVSPDTDLVTGQHVTVSGSGFPANLPVTLDVNEVAQPALTPQIAPMTVVASPTGEISASYPVHRLNLRFHDCAHVALGCEVRAKVGGATFGRAPIGFLPVQPDARLRRLSDDAIFFDDVYSPIASTTQLVQHAITPGGRWSYAVQIQNDGPVADDMTLRGSPSPENYFKIRYFVGFYDVTASVTGAGFTYRNMAAGEVRKLAVQFTALPDVPPDVGLGMTASLRFTSGVDVEARDTINLRVVARS